MRSARTAAMVAAAFLALPSAEAAAQAQKAQFAGMTAHVFLETSGRFSPPIGKIKDFSTWNMGVSGAGIPVGERFNAVLLKITLRSTGEVFAKGAQVVITVREQGRRPLRRYVLRDVYVGASGHVLHPLLLRDVGCRPLLIAIRSHGRVYQRKLNFRCGE